MTDSVLWYATRGAGAVSLCLLSAVFALGLLSALGWQRPSWPRFLSTSLHRNLALLALVFLLIHIVTAVVDPFTALGWQAAVVPFVASYRPLWLGIGVITIDLIAALVVTSLLRRFIGQRAWRLIHWIAYAAWPLAVIHSLGAGSDARLLWLDVVYAACAVPIAIFFVARPLLGPARAGTAEEAPPVTGELPSWSRLGATSPVPVRRPRKG